MAQRGFLSSLKQLFDPPPAPPPAPVVMAKVCINKPCSVEGQAKIEKLCAELCRKKEFITSGRLQLLGFSELKGRMGARWEHVKGLVQGVTEDALAQGLGRYDVYVRLQDDAYIIVFGECSVEEGRVRAAQIGREIRQRLSAVGEALQGIDVRRQLCQTPAAAIMGKSEGELADIFDKAEVVMPPHSEVLPEKQPAPDFTCSFMPLWAVRKGAITTFLCQPDNAAAAARGFESDMHILDCVLAEMQAMATDGRKFCLICPVSHETLYHRASFDRFTARLATLSPEQKSLLTLMVTGFAEEPKSNGCWFLSQLKGQCRAVYAEVDPAHRQLLASFACYKFDAIGCRLDAAQQTEAFGKLGACALAARSMGISSTFVLGIDTLSLATVSVCHGFSYLGGMAVDGAVKSPDTLYRYGNLDLLSKLVQ